MTKHMYSHAILIAATVAVLFALAPAPAAAQGTVEVGLLEGLNFQAPGLSQLIDGIRGGLMAAFDHANSNGGINGKTLVMVNQSTDFDPFKYAGFLQTLLTNHPNIVALAPTLGTVHSLFTQPLMAANNLVDIGPAMTDEAVHTKNENMMWMNPHPYAEKLALATQIVKKYRVKRLAFMYTTNHPFGYGPAQYTEMKKIMDGLGVDFVYVFRYDWSWRANNTQQTDIIAPLTEMYQANPDAVLVFGNGDESTVEFILGALTHPLAVNSPKMKFFLTPTTAGVAPLALGALKTMPALSAFANLDISDRFFSVFSNPNHNDVSFEFIRNYQRDMIARYGATWPTIGVPYITVGAYAAGRMIVDVLRKSGTTPTRRSVQQTIFGTSVWKIDDLTWGVYSGTCSAKQTSVCGCNHGAHAMYLGVLANNLDWQPVTDATYTWPISECLPLNVAVEQPTNYLRLAPASAVNGSLASLLAAGQAIAENNTAGTAFSAVAKGGIETRTYTDTTIESDLQSVNETLLVTAVGQSIVSPALEAFAAWAMVDPFYPTVTPSTAGFRRHVLRTSASPEQEIHAAAKYASEIGRGLSVVGPEASAFAGAVEGSGRTFGIDASVAGGTITAAVAGAADGSFILLAGVVDADAVAIATALAAKPSLYVALFSSEFQATYTALTAALAAAPTASAANVIVLTSLPNWGPGGAAASSVVTDYHRSLAGRAPHPLEFRSFVATRAAMTVLGAMRGPTMTENFLASWYATSTIVLDTETIMGPYFDASCASGASAATCECNLGPRRVNVFTLASTMAANSSAAASTVQFDSCSIEYKAPEEESKLHAGVIAAIAVGAVLVIAIIAIPLVGRNKDKRDTGFAPKDASKPYTLVFTDIQSSTSLWARVPDVMGPALDTHHVIIRKLIKKHKGYEVKTIGDAFMIAFDDATRALHLCEDLQREFFEYNWGTTAIDDTYKQLELEILEDDPKATDKAPSVHLPEALYKQSWNGLRVRCGCHTGMGDIKFDEITKGYDYYGNVPNIAARTEAAANGGQVLLTQFAMSAVGSTSASTQELQAVPLRGVPDPVKMFQVDVIASRKYAPLRVDAADEEMSLITDSDPEHSTDQEDNASSISSAFGNIDCNFRETLTLMLSMLDSSARKSTLQKLGEKWRVAGGQRYDENTIIKALSRRILSVSASKNRRKARADERASQLGDRASLLGVEVPTKRNSKRPSNVSEIETVDTHVIPDHYSKEAAPLPNSVPEETPNETTDSSEKYKETTTD